ncbi:MULTISPECIES: hypothetical protein [unclassified Bradyrhizobium]|uniref:hypothetical protein n=1 Tax=unclassified Bradyrhizobium TaxID=2631580 RepID=UPI0028E61A1D|nr:MULTISPECIES: hypothetical protein [unclassified Bradyrhizobium]
MTNRTTSLLPRVAVAVLAGAAAATIEFTPASAADECLAKPAGTPAGKHWFYRIDRATKKQCWYLRDDDREAKGASLVTRKLASQKERAQLSSTAANARAEIQSSSKDAADEVKVVSSTPTAAPSVPATSAFPSVAAFPAAPAPVASAPAAPDPVGAAVSESAVATRWPDQSGTLPAAAEPAAPRASSYTLAAASDTSAAEAAAPATPALAAADASPAVTLGMSGDDASRTRMFAFLGAVAIAGFSISVLFARARGRRQLRIEPVAARRVTRWPAEPELDRMHLPPVDSYYPALAGRRGKSSQPTAQVSVVPRDDVRYDEQYEVEDLLARYSGQERRNS